MTKKDYLLTLLTKLSWQWAYADWLKAVVEQTNIEGDVLDGLYNILSQAVAETVDAMKKDSLKKWLTALQKIQQLEYNENSHLDDELDTLLNQI